VVVLWLYAPWVVSYNGKTRRGDFQEQTWQFSDVCEPPLQRPLRVNDHALAPLSDNLVDNSSHGGFNHVVWVDQSSSRLSMLVAAGSWRGVA